MKKRLFTLFICVCMLTSMIPTIGANADSIRDAKIRYDDNVGSVFVSAGGFVPFVSSSCYAGGGDLYTYAESSGRLNLLIDSSLRVDWGEYYQSGNRTFIGTDNDFEPTVNIRIRYDSQTDGWHDEIAVRNGRPYSDRVSVTGEDLYSVDISGIENLEIEIYWSEEELDFAAFGGAKGKEVVVEVEWNGRGEIDLPSGIEKDDRICLDNRFKVRLSEGQKSLYLTWKEGFVLESVREDDLAGGWEELALPEGDAFTLQLDSRYADGGVQYYYHVRFDFGDDCGRNWKYRVEYDENDGSVFSTVGAALPSDAPENYVFRGGEGERSFKTFNESGEAKPGTINLFFDTEKRIDREARNDGDIAFFETDERDDRSVNVIIEYETPNGYMYRGVYIIGGELVRTDGDTRGFISWSDGILSFTPYSKCDVNFYVYWDEVDLAFGRFEPTEERPIVLEYKWWGRGGITLSEDLDPENSIIGDGRVIVRLPEKVHEVTFGWKPGYELNSISVDGAGENGERLEIERPEGTTYTMSLDQFWDNGYRKSHYYAEFSFEGGGTDNNGEFRFHYDMGRGSAFYSLGEAALSAEPEYYYRDDDRIPFVKDGVPQKVNVLIDPYYCADWDLLENEGIVELREISDREEPQIYITVRCELADGTFLDNEPVVIDGVSVNPAFTFENGILSFTPENDRSVELFLYWSAEDYEFDRFEGTEEKPVIVEVRWWNRGEISLADNIPAEDSVYGDGCFKVRLPFDKENLTLCWKPGYKLRRISASYLGDNGDWADLFDYEGDTFVIELNKTWDDGNPRDYYAVNFDFDGWIDRSSEFEVGYNEWDGAVFASVGEEALTDDGTHYIFHDREGRRSFDVGGEPGTIRLLVDPTKRLDQNDWYGNGGISFADVGPRDDLSINISAEFEDENGYIFKGLLVEKGEAVTDYATFENNVLTFTPASDREVFFRVYWTDEDCEFGTFEANDESPVRVEVSWWGDGEVSLPQDFPAGDFLKREGNIVARVSADAGSLVLTWGERDMVNYIGVRYEGAGDNFFEAEPTEGNTYVLILDKPGWNDGELSVDYHVEIGFEPRELDDYTVRFDFPASEGSLFYNVGSPAPSLDERYYMPTSECRYDVYDETGAVSVGTIYITLDPTRSINWYEWSRNGNVVFWDLPENNDYSPYIIVKYINEDGEWDEQFAVVNGRSTDPKFGYSDNVFSFTPETPHGVWVEVYWSRANMDYERFGPTEDKPVCVEIMGGNGVSPHIPDDIPGEDVVYYQGAEHLYCRIRLPLERDSLEFTWDMPNNVSLIEIDDLRAEDGVRYVERPEGTSFTLTLDQLDWNGEPLTNYYVRFWFYFRDPVDLSGVLAALDEYDGLDLTAYTEESVQAFNAKIAEAFDIFNNFEATQEDLDHAANVIYEAIGLLVSNRPEFEVDNYDFILYDAGTVNFMRIAPGVLTTSSEIRNHPELISVDNKLCDACKDETAF